jgi:hypothetical protein
MFTADQLVAHLVGDFMLQNDWMARNKYHSSLACGVHVVVYTLPFLFITQNPWTLLVIAGTHFAIDRWRINRPLIWVRNVLFPGPRPWDECSETGFSSDLPDHMARLLYIAFDGTLHILINGAAIYYLG